MIFALCVIFYQYYLNRKSKQRMSSRSRSNKKPFVEVIKEISLKKIYDDSVDYCTDFARRRPIMAALIALELGSWAYVGLKKFSKSFIWWNTVLELEIKGDYTYV